MLLFYKQVGEDLGGLLCGSLEALDGVLRVLHLFPPANICLEARIFCPDNHAVLMHGCF